MSTCPDSKEGHFMHAAKPEDQDSEPKNPIIDGNLTEEDKKFGRSHLPNDAHFSLTADNGSKSEDRIIELRKIPVTEEEIQFVLDTMLQRTSA